MMAETGEALSKLALDEQEAGANIVKNVCDFVWGQPDIKGY